MSPARVPSLLVQESPTRELAEQSFPEPPQPSGQPPASSSPPSPADRLSASDDSSDGNASEESKGLLGGIMGAAVTPTESSAPLLHVTGGGFEWDDDFPLMPVKPSLMASLTGMPAEPEPAVPALVPAQKQVLPIQFSRFTVSPAPVSRFSITHVSDSDMDSIGGESRECRGFAELPPTGAHRGESRGGVRDPLPSCPAGTVTPLKGWVSHGSPGTRSRPLSAHCRQQRGW